MMKKHSLHWILVLPLLMLAAGCGEDGPPRHAVSGKVTLDGEPISEGSIIFRDAEDQSASHGKIVDGSYSLETTEGQKTVEITARRPVPGKVSSPAPGEPAEPVLEQYIPEQYNRKTNLSADVPPGGKTDLNFELLSTKP